MKKILVVDNNKVVLRLIEEFLKRSGYEVATAEDGLAALNALESFPADVIFVDMIMPKISGEKLCRIVRNTPQFAKIALVVVSAILAEERLDFAAFGADACIAKGPFKLMSVHIATVLSLLEEGAYQELSTTVFGSDNLCEREITRELLAAKNHYELILENMVDIFLVLTSTGLIIFANRSTALLFAKSEAELLSTYFPDLFSVKYRDLLEEVLHSVDDYGVELGEDEPFSLGNKSLLVKFSSYYDQHKRQLIVVIQDISKRKRLESEGLAHIKKLGEMLEYRTVELEETRAA